MRDGSELAARLLHNSRDAVLAMNDAMAVGTLHWLRGLDARRRPAVTGFADIALERIRAATWTLGRHARFACGHPVPAPLGGGRQDPSTLGPLEERLSDDHRSRAGGT
jgi:hypothetical protein